MPEQPKIVTVGLLSETALQQLGATFRSHLSPLPADAAFNDLLARLDLVEILSVERTPAPRAHFTSMSIPLARA